MIGKIVGTILLLGPAVAVNTIILFDAVVSLRLTGAAQAMADFGFYVGLAVLGPLAAALALIGFLIAGVSEWACRPSIRLTLLGNMLFPLGIYLVFKMLW